MTDRQALLEYRMKQAEETLADAEKMHMNGIRKHAGVIALFDNEFVHTGKIDKQY